MDFIRFRKNPKIFEPLKRLLEAALAYFQNHTAPYGTFLHCVDALHKTRAS